MKNKKLLKATNRLSKARRKGMTSFNAILFYAILVEKFSRHKYKDPKRTSIPYLKILLSKWKTILNNH